VLVSPCNEALKAGRLTSHRLRGLVVTAPSKRAEFTLVTDEQLEIMAAKLGNDLDLLVWLGAFAGLRLGETLGINIADFRDRGTNLRLTRQRMADGSLAPAGLLQLSGRTMARAYASADLETLIADAKG
jgi:integrase